MHNRGIDCLMNEYGSLNRMLFPVICLVVMTAKVFSF